MSVQASSCSSVSPKVGSALRARWSGGRDPILARQRTEAPCDRRWDFGHEKEQLGNNCRWRSNLAIEAGLGSDAADGGAVDLEQPAAPLLRCHSCRAPKDCRSVVRRRGCSGRCAWDLGSRDNRGSGGDRGRGEPGRAVVSFGRSFPGFQEEMALQGRGEG